MNERTKQIEMHNMTMVVVVVFIVVVDAFATNNVDGEQANFLRSAHSTPSIYFMKFISLTFSLINKLYLCHLQQSTEFYNRNLKRRCASGAVLDTTHSHTHRFQEYNVMQ